MNDLFILTIPAELFSRFGLEIKQAMSAVCPIVWGYSNYSVGYLVDREEYGRSFESAASSVSYTHLIDNILADDLRRQLA